MLSKIQEHIRDAVHDFLTFLSCKKRKKNMEECKLYLMTKNTFALEYLNNFARFNKYAQNFFYAIAIFQSNYDYTCEPLTC